MEIGSDIVATFTLLLYFTSLMAARDKNGCNSNNGSVESELILILHKLV
jgi:hypothetical protein